MTRLTFFPVTLIPTFVLITLGTVLRIQILRTTTKFSHTISASAITLDDEWLVVTMYILDDASCFVVPARRCFAILVLSAIAGVWISSSGNFVGRNTNKFQTHNFIFESTSLGLLLYFTIDCKDSRLRPDQSEVRLSCICFYILLGYEPKCTSVT